MQICTLTQTQPHQHPTTLFFTGGMPFLPPNQRRQRTEGTHTQPFYGSMDFVRDNPGEPVPEETFTHSHLLWSSIIPFLLHPSTMIHGILPVQPKRLTVSKFSLVYFLAWHPPLHTPYISSPNHCLLFATHAHTIATCFAILPRLCHLSLNPLLGILCYSFMPHIHLTILISAD